MRYLSIYRPGRVASGPPPQSVMDGVTKLIEDMSKEGKFLGTEGALPNSLGAHVTLNSGKFDVAETAVPNATNALGGYAILKADSKAEVIEMAKTFLKVMGEGSCEIYQLMDMPENCAEEMAKAESSHDAGKR